MLGCFHRVETRLQCILKDIFEKFAESKYDFIFATFDDETTIEGNQSQWEKAEKVVFILSTCFEVNATEKARSYLKFTTLAS